MYNVLLNVLPAGRALEQNARIPLNDCNCFKVTFLKKAMRLICLKNSIGSNYYIDKCLPMGCSISCSTFDFFSTFIHWLVNQEHCSQNLDHYLDDFFFAGESNTDNCKRLMKTFDHV
jgi:hypothetical protein